MSNIYFIHLNKYKSLTLYSIKSYNYIRVYSIEELNIEYYNKLVAY